MSRNITKEDFLYLRQKTKIILEIILKIHTVNNLN
jgi:hypothetical protein